jgi:DNA-binding response OmpR family regulator
METEPQLLITDDDRDFRETLAEAMQRRGFAVTLAANGRQAVNLVRAQTFHLVVLDMHMPELSGLDTILQVRKWFDSLACILMSARLDDQIVMTAKSIPTVEVMSKPFPLQSFTDTIRDTLRRAYDWPMI